MGDGVEEKDLEKRRKKERTDAIMCMPPSENLRIQKHWIRTTNGFATDANPRFELKNS